MVIATNGKLKQQNVVWIAKQAFLKLLKLIHSANASINLFKKMGVLTEKELHARNEVKWETYTKKIQIEARVLGDLAINHIIPVATRYQSLLLDNVYKIKSVFTR